MSFADSIDRLVYTTGKATRCAGFRVYEAWHFEEGLSPVYLAHEDSKTLDNWASWLYSTSNAAPPPGVVSKASLKVLVVRTEPIPKPYAPRSPNTAFKREEQLLQHAEELSDFFEQVKLPNAGLASYLKNLAQYGYVPSVVSAEPRTSRFFFSDPSICWTWSHSPSTSTTHAILLCRDIVNDDRPIMCRAILERQQHIIDQPLLLAYLCIELMGSRLSAWIGDMIVPDLLQIERQTGLATWDPGSESELPPIQGESDTFKHTLSRVTILSESVTDIRFRLSSLLAYIPIVQRLNRKHALALRARLKAFRRLNGGKHDPVLATSLHQCERLGEIVEAMGVILAVRMRKAESLADRIANQVVTVENLRAQKMAEDSRALSKGVKRDSSSMTTIAAVTMVFLPGTFVAALFAMPLFQWGSADQQGVVNQKLWIYWAVTSPLTLAVFGFWVLYLWMKDRKEKREDEKWQYGLAHTVER